jgi:hypothetical protein
MVNINEGNLEEQQINALFVVVVWNDKEALHKMVEWKKIAEVSPFSYDIRIPQFQH